MRLQLSPQAASPRVRGRLRAAACVLLAGGLPAAARAQTGDASQFDSSVLLYGEKNRADVVEPRSGDAPRANGQAFSVGLVDADHLPDRVFHGGQTITSASGTTSTVAAGTVPTTSFHDKRYAFDGNARLPLTRLLASTLAAHISTEKDYSSFGGSATFALDADQRRLTISAGASYDHDGVPSAVRRSAHRRLGTDGSGSPAHVAGGCSGSRVISPLAPDALGHAHREDGYLTEPYKVVSTIDPPRLATGQLTELRPGSRLRNDVLATSVSAIGDDVLHLSYRYYWDDWSLESHTADLKYRHDLNERTWLQPHLRWYRQNPASFYTTGLVAGAPLPAFASSDYRLGPLRTMTVGATFGFHLSPTGGEWSVRPEWIRQTLAHPHGEGGHDGETPQGEEARIARASEAALATPDAFALEVPPLDIVSVVIAYSLRF
jgi:hypothetical protein